jgi:hypothetical protein
LPSFDIHDPRQEIMCGLIAGIPRRLSALRGSFDGGTAVDDFLREAQVRSWQRELVVPALAAVGRRPTTPDEARRAPARRVVR